ncbi:hypothetical protein BGZ63DRAFT_374193 [Mariannaea sp. PMI_226]|nr:hypothetical protein BGZ63DRAFT_374193 [Mariannaea sp. PMI_226]
MESMVINSTGIYHNTIQAPSLYNSYLAYFADAAFYTAMFAPSSISQGPLDAWGNVKIPFFKAHTPNVEGWHAINASSRDEYSAFIGIPIANITTGNSTFVIETSYIQLECSSPTVHALNESARSFSAQETFLNDTFKDVGYDEALPHILNGTWYGLQYHKTPSVFILGIDQFIDSEWWQLGEGSWDYVVTLTTIEAGPTNLLFQARVNTTIFDASWEVAAKKVEVDKSECRVLQKYVESRIKCSRPSGSSPKDCSVIAQRKSRRIRPSENLSMLSVPAIYLNGSCDPLVKNPYLGNVRASELGARLSQLINSYILLAQAGVSIQEFLPTHSKDPTDLANENVRTMETETVGLVYAYKISCPWMVACLISCIMLSSGSAVGVIFRHLARGPEILGLVSTIFRDSKYVDIPAGMENDDGHKVSNMMKEERFQYGNRDGAVGIMREEDVERKK